MADGGDPGWLEIWGMIIFFAVFIGIIVGVVVFKILGGHFPWS